MVLDIYIDNKIECRDLIELKNFIQKKKFQKFTLLCGPIDSNDYEQFEPEFSNLFYNIPVVLINFNKNKLLCGKFLYVKEDEVPLKCLIYNQINKNKNSD